MSKINRKNRIRKTISSVSLRPRLSVFRSNKYIYAQIIDVKGDAVLGFAEKNLEKKGTRIENARELGKQIAKMAVEKKIKQVVFDKGRFSYHGKVKAVAEGAREGGLDF